MAKKSAKKLVKKGTSWYHVSPNGRKFRRIKIPGKCMEVLSTGHVPDEQTTQELNLSEIEEILNLPVGMWNVQDHVAWALVADRLEKRTTSKKKTVVPKTPLRKLYTWLRGYPRLEFNLALAKGFSDSPNEFAKLVRESIEGFCEYNNLNQHFVPKSRKKKLKKSASGNLGTTNKLVALLQEFVGDKECPVTIGDQNLGNLNFTYIERELSPVRTQRGVFDTGEFATASGKGGIDVLLRSNDGIPTIGEIKIGGDSNEFLALVQALTYAVELCTKQQHARLEKHFEAFRGLNGDPKVDVYLVNHNITSDDLRPKIAEATRNLIGKLFEVKGNNPFGNQIRRVAILNVRRPDDELQINCEFVRQ